MSVVVFEREALYQEVCNSPITALAGKYGLSDNGLRKICVALDIPLPGRGHWQKLAAGKPSRVPPLRPTKGRTRYHCDLDDEPQAPKSATPDWLNGGLAFEKDSLNAIVVADTLQAPSRLVAHTKKQADDLIANLERSRARSLKPKKTDKKWEPDFSPPPHWGVYADKGFLHMPGGGLPLRVSIEQVDRALRIWDALIKAAVGRNFVVSVENARLRLGAHGHAVDLRISERIERVVGSPKGLSQSDIFMNRHIKYVPSGDLRIFVEEKKFTDGPIGRIEGQLNAVVVAIYKALDGKRAWSERIDAERVRAESARQAATALEAEVEAKATAEAAERAREAALEAEAGAWQRAAAIRAYVAHVVDGTPDPVPPASLQWVQWSTTVADRLDPTPRRIEASIQPTDGSAEPGSGN